MNIIGAYENLTRSEMDYYFMSTLSDWFNHTGRSDEDIIFALKYVGLGDYCEQCDRSNPVNPMRFPVAVSHDTKSWVTANYECHVCSHLWTCSYSTEYVNTFSFE